MLFNLLSCSPAFAVMIFFFLSFSYIFSLHSLSYCKSWKWFKRFSHRIVLSRLLTIFLILFMPYFLFSCFFFPWTEHHAVYEWKERRNIFCQILMATESTANVSYILTCEIIFLILGAFPKIASLYLSVRPSARMEKLDFHGRIFIIFYIWLLWENLPRK